MPSSLTVIVPAYNEEINLAGAVETVQGATANRVTSLQVIIVDDGSTDSTGAIADEIALHDVRIKVVHNGINKGLGYSYRRGLEIASEDYVIMIPGDNENSTVSISPIVDQLGEADIIVPYVLNPEVRPMTRRLLSKAFVATINILCGLSLQYFNGTCAIRRNAIQAINLDTHGFAYMAATLVRLLKLGYTYQEVGIELDKPKGGSSKAFMPRNIAQVLRTVFALFWEVRVTRTRQI
ncbi:glycosyltransferase family 2 protein [SAR202 cluster bacterium AD-804-J14_MRT_500m]|nr:glycosyltransferase family 2 protein [SAR202 cluster bacterium AD-804-J14_MRT_500m]